MSNEQKIRERAYEIWQERGEPHGAHDEIWLDAEREVAAAAGAENQETTDVVRSKKVGEAATRAVAGTDDLSDEV